MGSVQNLKSKRWSFIIVVWVLLIAQTHLYFQGLFMTKKELTNKNNQFTNHAKTKPKKLIMMLVDALREDFVDFGDETSGDK